MAVLAEIYLLKFALLLEAICYWRRPAVVDLDPIDFREEVALHDFLHTGQNLI
jgi:hypothetical protein